MAGGGEERLHHLLVHAGRGRGDARAHVGHARQLQQALDGAVLAEGAVQHGEVHVRPQRALRVVQPAQAALVRRLRAEEYRPRRPVAAAPGRVCSHQRPSWSMSTGRTRWRAASPAATDTAERRLTSCSPERPPNSSAISRGALIDRVVPWSESNARPLGPYTPGPHVLVPAGSDLRPGPRGSLVTTAHGAVETPAFMPVGTAAPVKAVTPRDLREVGRADHPRQHVPPHAAARRRARGRTRRPARLHALARALPDGQRRLSGLQPGRAAQADRGGRVLPQPPRRLAAPAHARAVDGDPAAAWARTS